MGDEVRAATDAWRTKYNLPSKAMTALTALVAAESVNFKSMHVTLMEGNKAVHEIAAGGRNWNGQVSLAFAFASASTTIYDPTMQCKHNPVHAYDFGLQCGGWDD